MERFGLQSNQLVAQESINPANVGACLKTGTEWYLLLGLEYSRCSAEHIPSIVGRILDVLRECVTGEAKIQSMDSTPKG